MHMNSTRQQRHRQGGLGIVEVLVALVVVSFGVLGMASLQLTGMKHSSSGYSRSKALLMAEDMATRMRINTTSVADLDYDGFDSDTINCSTPPVAYCQARPGAALPAQCNAADLAEFDLFSVSCGAMGSGGADTGVVGDLPEGRLEVSCNDVPCTATSPYTITVSWLEGRVAGPDAEDTDVKRVQMRLRP